MVSSFWQFYLFYVFNALGYMCGGPLPNQVLHPAGLINQEVRQWALPILGLASAVCWFRK